MCCADDLILCSHGDFVSIHLMPQGFKLFSDFSGLQANKNKTSLYICGMKEEDIQKVKDISGYVHNHMPLRYLGVPICSKRLFASQGEILIKKMSARIKIWSSRNLS